MVAGVPVPGKIVRGPVTWYAYLVLGFFTFALNIQGNILPFLRADLGLSYRVVSLHSSAVAAGMIIVGLFGDLAIRRIGRRAALSVGSAAVVLGGIVLSQGSVAWVTIASCGLIGAVGALVPATVFALLADIHGKNRDAAYAEANAVCYAFAILAPLSMGLFLSLGLGWRSAVIFGMVLGGAIALYYSRTPVPEARRVAGRKGGVLPPAYWAYWAALGLGCAVEFCVLLWAPSFLEQVGGLSKPWAATFAAAFALAMLVGRTAGSALVRHYSTHQLFIAAIVVALGGFALYWTLGSTFLVVPGLFVVGLGVALFYPLLLGLAVGAAGELGDLASARTMLAVGIAVLTMPALLGTLADEVGLRAAHLMLPVLVLLVLGCFLVAQALERRALQPA